MIVAGWPQHNGPCVPFLNRVIVGLVHLHAFAKLEATVLGGVDGDPYHYLAWAEVPPADSEGGRELIQKMTKATSSSIILPGIFLKGIVL